MKIKRLPQKLNPKLQRDFGWIIKQMREECGLSQLELAKELGLKSATAVSLWEHCRRKIDLIRMWEIACICGYQVDIKPLTP